MELESYPTKLKRDLRVSSPQPLFRALADLLEENGFRLHTSDAPELKAGVLPGTATFKGRLLGVRDSIEGVGTRGLGLWLTAVGALVIVAMAVLLAVVDSLDVVFSVLGLVAGTVVLITGLGKLREPDRRLRRLIDIHLEGESYQAGAIQASAGGLESPGTGMRLERSGVVSDARVTVCAGVGHPEGEDQVSRWLPRREAEVLQLVSEMQGKPLPKKLTQKELSGTVLGTPERGSLPARRLSHRLNSIAERFALSEHGGSSDAGSSDDS